MKTRIYAALAVKGLKGWTRIIQRYKGKVDGRGTTSGYEFNYMYMYFW